MPLAWAMLVQPWCCMVHTMPKLAWCLQALEIQQHRLCNNAIPLELGLRFTAMNFPNGAGDSTDLIVAFTMPMASIECRQLVLEFILGWKLEGERGIRKSFLILGLGQSKSDQNPLRLTQVQWSLFQAGFGRPKTWTLRTLSLHPFLLRLFSYSEP